MVGLFRSTESSLRELSLAEWWSQLMENMLHFKQTLGQTSLLPMELLGSSGALVMNSSEWAAVTSLVASVACSSKQLVFDYTWVDNSKGCFPEYLSVVDSTLWMSSRAGADLTSPANSRSMADSRPVAKSGAEFDSRLLSDSSAVFDCRLLSGYLTLVIVWL